MLAVLPTQIVGLPAAPAPLGNCILYGILLSLAGLLGDLCESLIKRDMQKKDSSGRLPGLGGILDLTDSLVFAAPAAFVCWYLGLLGP